MRIIDEIGKKYPALDLESIRILLTIQEHPGFCIREVADVLVLNPKLVQEKIVLMSTGRENRKKTSRLNLVNTGHKESDKRKRDLMLTGPGQSLAILLRSLNNNEAEVR